MDKIEKEVLLGAIDKFEKEKIIIETCIMTLKSKLMLNKFKKNKNG